MDIPKIVYASLTKTLVGRRQLSDRLWLFAEISRQHFVTDDIQNIVLHVAPCEGGAYSCFGRVEVKSDTVAVHLKTVHGIMNHRFDESRFRFLFCDPGFPDNMVIFIEKAATIAHKCFDLSHTRSCKRLNRQLRGEGV